MNINKERKGIRCCVPFLHSHQPSWGTVVATLILFLVVVSNLRLSHYIQQQQQQEEEKKLFRHEDETNHFAASEQHWKHTFLLTIPTPDEVWPIRPRLSNEPHSISTLVPALTEDVPHNLPSLLQSIKQQTHPATEVVVVVSNVLNSITGNFSSSSGGNEWCHQTHHKLQQKLRQSSTSAITTIPLRLVCLGERVSAGRARNVAARMASSQIYSFIDADDTEFPHRNAIITNIFHHCHYDNNTNTTSLKLLLHGFRRRARRGRHKYDVTRKAHGDVSKWGIVVPPSPHNDTLPSSSSSSCVIDSNVDAHVEVLRYPQLEPYLKEKHLWVHADVHHGHIVVHRSVMMIEQHKPNYQYSTMTYGDDALFVRDVLYGYGRQPNAVIFVNRPLTSYFVVGNRGKEVF